MDKVRIVCSGQGGERGASGPIVIVEPLSEEVTPAFKRGVLNALALSVLFFWLPLVLVWLGSRA